jgi:hypothetical protein
MKRRQFIQSTGATLLTAWQYANAAPGSGNVVTEQQKGDPDAEYEHVSFDGDAVRKMAERPGDRAVFEKWDKALPSKMLATARDFLGISRDTTPDRVSEFLKLFDLPYKDDNGYLAFCAAGLSYCALQTYVKSAGVSSNDSNQQSRLYQLRRLMPDLDHYYFYPTVSCVDMYLIAAGRHRWIEHKTHSSQVPKPGWVVLFDWRGSGTADHCGLVVSGTKDKILTIEFNTSGRSGGSQRDGGTVAEKERTYKYIKGFVVTDRVPAG